MKHFKMIIIAWICIGLICALEAYKIFANSTFMVKALLWAGQIDAGQFFAGFIFGIILSIPYIIWVVKDVKRILNKNKRDRR